MQIHSPLTQQESRRGDSAAPAALVSVIIPSYNAAATIERSLDSARAQTLKSLEIIVIDDGSTDATVDLIERLVRNGNPIQLIRMAKNGGVSAARNAGIAAARGRYLAFLDADDTWLPEKLARQVAAIEQDPAITLVSCNSRLVSQDGQPLKEGHVNRTPVTGADAWKTLLVYNFIPTPTVLTHTSLVREIGGFDESLKVGEDLDLWIRLGLRGKIAVLPEIYTNYYDLADSLMKRHSERSGDIVVPMLEKHIMSAAQAGKLNNKEIRHMRGARAFQMGCNLFFAGNYMASIPIFLQAIMNGARPFKSLTYIPRALWAHLWRKRTAAPAPRALSAQRPLQILISGWYGHFNRGDDAILEVFIEQARRRSPCHITVLSERPQDIAVSNDVSATFHPAISSFRHLAAALRDASLWRHLLHLRGCDLFVLGGGGLLRDNTSWRNLLRLLDEVWLSKLMGRKVMLYAIGVGPFKTRRGKYLIGMSARMCDLITVRSQRGADLLIEVGVAPERIHVVADPAFLLEPAQPTDPALLALLAGKDKIGVFPTVSLVTTPHSDIHVLSMAAALDRLAEEKGLQFVAFGMRVRERELDDIAVSRAIQRAMRRPEALTIYEQRLTAAELKWVSGQNKMNITVRLHAMIFSLGAGVPVVAVNYEPKVANVFASFDSPQYLVEMDGVLGDALYDAVSLCLDNLAPYRATIRALSPKILSDSQQTFTLMEGLYPPPP